MAAWSPFFRTVLEPRPGGEANILSKRLVYVWWVSNSSNLKDPSELRNARPIWLWMAMVLPMLAVGITIAAASSWTFEGIVALREADPKTADIEELRSEAITAFLTRVTAITGIYAALAGFFSILSHFNLYDNKPLDLVSKSLAFGAAAYLAVYSLMAAPGS